MRGTGRSGGAVRARIAGHRVGDPGGHGGQGGGLEHGAHRQLDAEAVAHAGEQLGGAQRVAAQGEEVVVAADAVDAEQRGPDGGQGFFNRAIRLCAAKRARRRGRQGGAVQLAGRGERQAGQRHDRGRHHEVGQDAGDEPAQLVVERDGVERGGGARVACHDVGDQLRVAQRAARIGAGAGRDHDLAHGGVAGQRRLDLAQLDAEAAHLDLSVGASGPLDLAVGAVATQVAGQVQPVVRAARERAGHELAGGGLDVAEVAAGQVRAAHADLAQLADAGQAAAGCQHKQLDIAHAAAERQRVGAAGAGHDPVIADRALGLGRAVQVDRLDAGRDAADPIDVAPGQHVSDDEGAAQAGDLDRRAGGGLGQELGHGRGQVRDGDLAARSPRGQVARLGHAVRVGHADGGAELERGEDVALQRVVRQAGQHAEAIALAQAELVALPGHEVGQRAVQAHDALGHAGRPGGERQARGVVGADGDARRRVLLARPRLGAGPCGQVDQGAVGVTSQPLGSPPDRSAPTRPGAAGRAAAPAPGARPGWPPDRPDPGPARRRRS